MRIPSIAGALLLLCFCVFSGPSRATPTQPNDSPSQRAASLSTSAAQWWADIAVLADDKMEGLGRKTSRSEQLCRSET